MSDHNGYKVRLFDTPDGPRWAAVDLCRVLELKGGTSYWTAFLEDKDKGVSIVHTLGRRQRLQLVTQSGLYRLLFQSNTPAAMAWQEWFCDMLCCLWRHGCYPAPEPMTCAGPGKAMVKPDSTGPDLLRAIGIPMPEGRAATL